MGRIVLLTPQERNSWCSVAFCCAMFGVRQRVISPGIRDTSRDHLVDVTVDGAGVLQAMGSARPASDEPFHSSSCTTFDGRAIAIIRPTGSGGSSSP